MNNPANDATATAQPPVETSLPPDTHATETTAVEATVPQPEKNPQDAKTISLISWTSIILAFLPLILLVIVADGYESIARFSPTESLFFPVFMFAISYIGSRYAQKTTSFISKGLNALFGTFYIFLFMLYLASGVVGVNAVLIIPLILPVILPVVFIWLLGIKVTMSKLRGHPVDKDGNPVDPKTLDLLKETLPDKTFAELVFQILGVFTAILLGFFVTTGILNLM